MERGIKIYKKALDSIFNIEFTELCLLMEYIGYIFERQSKSSHCIYKHPDIKNMYDSMLNIQVGNDGKAKPKQVRVVLDIIEKYNLIEKKEGESHEQD